jgi:hypothetical protein
VWAETLTWRMAAQAAAPAGEYGEAEEGASSSEAGALDGTQQLSVDAPFGSGITTDEVFADVRGLLANPSPWGESFRVWCSVSVRSVIQQWHGRHPVRGQGETHHTAPPALGNSKPVRMATAAPFAQPFRAHGNVEQEDGLWAEQDHMD